MRLYLKAALIIVVFCLAAKTHVPRASFDRISELHDFVVYCCGSAADREALIDEAQRRIAVQDGRPDVYLAGKRSQQLFAERLAAAASRGIRLTPEQIDRLHAECNQEAFQVQDKSGAAVAGETHDGLAEAEDDAGPAPFPSTRN